MNTWHAIKKNGTRCKYRGKNEHKGKRYCGIHIKVVSIATDKSNINTKPPGGLDFIYLEEGEDEKCLSNIFSLLRIK